MRTIKYEDKKMMKRIKVVNIVINILGSTYL